MPHNSRLHGPVDRREATYGGPTASIRSCSHQLDIILTTASAVNVLGKLTI